MKIQESKHYTRYKIFSLEEIAKHISNQENIWIECNGKVRKFSFKQNRFQLMLRDNFSCVACDLKATHFWMEKNGRGPHFNLYAENRTPGAKYDIMFTSDHIYPKSLGGSNEIENLQLMCASCNHKKGNRIISSEEFRNERKQATACREKYYELPSIDLSGNYGSHPMLEAS